MKTIKIINIEKTKYTGIVTHNCLPKDIMALASWAESIGYRPELFWEVLESNKRIGEHRRKQR